VLLAWNVSADSAIPPRETFRTFGPALPHDNATSRSVMSSAGLPRDERFDGFEDMPSEDDRVVPRDGWPTLAEPSIAKHLVSGVGGFGHAVAESTSVSPIQGQPFSQPYWLLVRGPPGKRPRCKPRSFSAAYQAEKDGLH